MEARTALSRPLHGNLAPNQTITKMDTAPAVTMPGPTSNGNSSVNAMAGRQPIVGGISTTSVKVEPTTMPPIVSAPAFSHVTPISNVASQGISALQTSSPSLISQEANMGNDNVQEHKPIINPVQQPIRPGGHGSLLNNLSQVRLMNSTSLGGGATSMGLPNMGATPIQVHMSNMISSGMTSTPSVISSMSGPGQPISTQQMVQSTALGSFGSNTPTVTGNSTIAVSSSLTNNQSSMGMGQSVQSVAQGGLVSGSQLGQGGIVANQNVMSTLGPTAISSTPAMMPTPGMVPQTGVNSLGVNNNSAMNMPITQQHANAQQPPPKYVKIWEGTLSGQRQGQPVIICKLEVTALLSRNNGS
ncbi:Mediator of RNA polymerase II transcription subunit 25 [Zea mays]|uniref:Mediator of RNA polymerase II transcription subunit 25 n=1 Tax=Zea mays TaxID=4577 RepID=A0A1D6ENX5_MAIZE|nr:Mediator of RNA polymerase II transcription subunit 25 [Zea mays]